MYTRGISAGPNTTMEVITELHVRFSDSTLKDLVVPVDDLSAINNKYLRKLIRTKDPVLYSKTANRRLRFIYNGQRLQDSFNFEESLKKFYQLTESQDEENEISEENQETSSKSKGKEKLATEDELKHKVKVHKIYIHCMIGDELSKEELEQEDQLDNTVQEPSSNSAPIGFDRLLSAGFSQDEVSELRREFQNIHGTGINQRNVADLDEEFDTDEEDDADSEDQDIRQLEERWIEGSANESLVTGNGHWRFGLSAQGDTASQDLLVGLVIGCFFGVLSLFLLKGEFKFFNKYTRISIVAGIIINLGYSVMWQWVEALR